MLLNTIKRFLRSDRYDERGNAMIAVVGLIAVTSLITVTITAATVQALGFTSLTRAGVQSNAAAESGVDAMLAALTANACPASGELSATQGSVNPSLGGAAASAPFYVATVAQRISIVAAWTPGCPSDASTQIRIQSTGFATDQGVAQSASANDASAVQAIYEWVPGAGSAAVTGAAVYSYGSPGLANNLDLLSFNGNSANIIVREGNIICTNSVDVEGDIVAANGNIELSNACSAGGNVWASGTVTINSGTKTIGKDVIAAGTGQSSINRTGATIGGGVYARGPLFSGSLCSSGTDQQVIVGDPCAGILSTGADPVFYNRTDVAAPSVPSWVDVDFVEANWVSRGWTVQTYTGPCNIRNTTVGDPQVTAFSTYTTPTVIDMRGCPEVLVDSNAGLEITMSTDLTFIMPTTVTLGNFTVRTTGSFDRALRFITPDTVADNQPTSIGCGSFTIANQNEVEAPVAIMVYTPCDLNNSQRLDWRGQYYGKTVTFSQNSTVTYVPIGIPGFDLGNGSGGPGGGGAVGGPATPGSPGDLLDYTDIDVVS